MLRRILSFLMMIVFVLQSVSPTFAALDSLLSLEDEKVGELYGRGIPIRSAPYFKSDPDRTAAGILIYAEHEGQLKVLLGRRDVEKEGWCTFGGKSDETDEFLYVTGAREVEEESFGIYAFHPRVVRDLFFQDIYDPRRKTALYRMYWAKAQYVAASVFKEKLVHATDKHQQEYTDFAWVPLKDLIAMVQGDRTFDDVMREIRVAETTPTDKRDPQEADPGRQDAKTTDARSSPSREGEQEVLFEPLYHMLRETSVQAKMRYLLEGKDRAFNVFHTHNTLSFARRDVALVPTYVKWEVISREEAMRSSNFETPGSRKRMVMHGRRPDARRMYGVDMETHAADTSEEREAIYGTDGQFYRYGDRVKLEENELLMGEVVTFDPLREKERVVETLVSKARLNVEIKRRAERIKKEQRTQERKEGTKGPKQVKINAHPQENLEPTRELAAGGPEAEVLSSPLRTYTASEAHLRLALGDEYVHGTDRAAYKENFRRLIARYGMVEELRREVKLTEEALDLLAKIYEREREVCCDERLQGTPYGYTAFNHGLAEDMMSLIQAFSAGNEILFMEPNTGFSHLRGTNAYMDLYREFNEAIETFYGTHRKFYLQLYKKYQDPQLIEASAEYKAWIQKEHAHLHEIMERTLPLLDTHPHNGPLWLWVNAAIGAGKATTKTTSSSVEYYLNSHSVNMPNDEKRFEEAAALRGMEAFYAPYRALFYQFPKSQAPAGEGNGGFLQVFVRDDQLDPFSVTVHGGGTLYGHPISVPERARKPWVSRLLDLLHKEAEMRDKSVEEQISENLVSRVLRTALYPDDIVGPPEERDYAKSLISEVQILQYPVLMGEDPKVWEDMDATDAADAEDSEAVEAYDVRYRNSEFPRAFVEGYYRYPLTGKQQDLYRLELQNVAWAQTVDWLLQETFPLEGSFYREPAIKRLYRRVYQDLTGVPPAEKVYTGALPYLIGLGNVEPVKSFLAVHPRALEDAEIDFNHQFLSLCWTSKWEMAIYLYDLIGGGRKLTEILSPSDIMGMMRSISEGANFTKEAAAFFKDHVDLRTFERPLHRLWIRSALTEEPVSVEVLRFFLENGCELAPQERKMLISSVDNLREIKCVVDAGYPVDAEDEEGSTLLENLWDLRPQGSQYPGQYNWEEAMLDLLQKGADWRRNKRNPGIPIFFELALHRVNYPNWERALTGIMPDLQNYRNSEGLTFLQYLQRSYLRGGDYSLASYPSLETALIPGDMTYGQAAFPAFLEYYPGPENRPVSSLSPWSSDVARAWQAEFDVVWGRRDLKEVWSLMMRPPSPSLLQLNRCRIEKYFPCGRLTQINQISYDAERAHITGFCEKMESALGLADDVQARADLEALIEGLKATLNPPTYISEDLYVRLFKGPQGLEVRYPDLYAKFQEKISGLPTENYLHDTQLLDPIKEDLIRALEEGFERTEAVLRHYEQVIRENFVVYLLHEGDFGSLFNQLFDFETLKTLEAKLFEEEGEEAARAEMWRKEINTHVTEKNLAQVSSLVDLYPFKDGGASLVCTQYLSGPSSRTVTLPPLLSRLMRDEFVSLIPNLMRHVHEIHWPTALTNALQEAQYQVVQAFFEHQPDLLRIARLPHYKDVVSEFLSTDEIGAGRDVLLSKLPLLLGEGDSSVNSDLSERVMLEALRSPSLRDHLPLQSLKAISPENGVPHFWYFTFTSQNVAWAVQIVGQDPSFLGLKSIEGLDLRGFRKFLQHSGTHAIQMKHVDLFLKRAEEAMRKVPLAVSTGI